MSYSKSKPLRRWLGERRELLDRLRAAHAQLGEVEGPGCPKELSRPLAHAYLIQIVAEFQRFARDLHDLATEQLLLAAQPAQSFVPVLMTAMTRGRAIDPGNATLHTLRTDFGRLGLRNLEGKLASLDARWDKKKDGTDLTRFHALMQVRNALAHGNGRLLDELRRQGHLDTVSWGNQHLPVLNRAARLLDTLVWHHLVARTGGEPW